MVRNWLERSKQDIAYALRSFARTPGFTATVIVTLALGIGATSAIFSIVNAVLLHPLPYPHADRLVVVWEKLTQDAKSPPVFDSYRDFQTWKKESRSFEFLAPATWATGQQIVTGLGRAREVLAMPVGIDFFDLLGAKPAIGRLFQPGDLGRGCTVVLKYNFWTNALGAQAGIAGKHITLGQRACTVAGVTPADFTFYPDALSMWMLITPDSEIVRDPEHANVGVFAVLKPGVSIARAQREVETLYRNQHRKDPLGLSRIPVVHPLAEEFAYLTGPNLRRTVIVLFAAVFFVLLIACVNIANLLLGRSLVRQRELAVRAALGSGRLRLIRQLLKEGLLLSCAGALGGIVLAVCAVHYFRVLNPIDMPPGNPVRVNLYVLAFAAVLAFVTAMAFALAPALKASRIDLMNVLRASGGIASFGPTSRALRQLMVAAEVTLSLVLLVGAGLLIESANRLASVPLGFRTARASSLSIELPKWSYAKANQRAKFYRDLLDRASVLPGVEAAAFASSLPLDNGRWRASVLTIEGAPEPTFNTAVPEVGQSSITPQYFQVMGVPLENGRLFDPRDHPGSEQVAIVNQALARKYFPRENPIGRHIKVGEPGTERPWLRIIGEVGDEKDRDFFHEMAWEDIPLVFRPVAQDPPLRGSLVLRTFGDEIAVGGALQQQITALDSSVAMGEMEPLNKRLAKLFAYPRFRAAVLGAFAALALVLAAVGLYGVLSHLTEQRMREFGVRLALGAQKRDLLGLVIRQGLLLTGAGLAAGLILGLGLERVLNGLLYEVKATDPWTLAAVSALLLVVSLLATWLPARRAARVDPMVTLHYE